MNVALVHLRQKYAASSVVVQLGELGGLFLSARMPAVLHCDWIYGDISF